jgi:hypothetical protein
MGGVMTRTKLLEAASSRLTEVALLLVVAGEDHLAAEAEELAEWVDLGLESNRGVQGIQPYTTRLRMLD